MKKDRSIDEILQDLGFSETEKQTFNDCLNEIKDNTDDAQIDKYIMNKIKETVEHEIQEN